MVRILRFALIMVLISVGVSFAQAPAAPAGAPAWQGKGKMAGKVVDEAGKAVPGVTVKVTFLPAGDGTQVVTDSKGEWKFDKLAAGQWAIEVSKDGLDPRRLPVEVGGKTDTSALGIKMTKEGTDPAYAMQTGAVKAQSLFEQKKYADARAVFEGLFAKYPTVHVLHQNIAVSYYLEKNYDKAIEQFQEYLKDAPGDNRVKLTVAKVLFEAGKTDEAWTMFSTFDTTVLMDVLDLEEPGFSLLRAKKPLDAVKYFDRVVTLYPADPQGYYYRGLSYWQIGATVEKPNTPEFKAKMELAKADLTKFISMVPSAAADPKDPNNGNVQNAQKMLEQIK